MGRVSFLECTGTGEKSSADELQGLSKAGKPFFARYDLDSLAGHFTPEAVRRREADLWRYDEVLPVQTPGGRISLGEGWTPLLPVSRLGERVGLPRLLIKDEGQNPTGSFKARGMAVAVARALELGARELALPSAGNAGSAAAAYGAAAGVPVRVVLPEDTPSPILEEIRALGGDVILVDGLITDCGRLVREGAEENGWWDLSTLKEPYRVEGKKTLGYELFEQLGGSLPDWIVYPTGGGTGLIGMWKAFHEMEALGWIGSERPGMVAVQASGCAPAVRAWEAGEDRFSPWPDARTYASGIRVPQAVGDFLILEALRESGGAAVAVPEAEIYQWASVTGQETGIFPAPEGGAVVAALPRLLEMGVVEADDQVVAFNTGSGLKYVGMEPQV